MNNAPPPAGAGIGDEFDPQTMERLRALDQAKVRAVQEEDYDEAKRCKEMIVRLRSVGTALKQCEERKRQAVANEDYDTAKAIKIEIDRLRQSIERPQAADGAVQNSARRRHPGVEDVGGGAGVQPRQRSDRAAGGYDRRAGGPGGRAGEWVWLRGAPPAGGAASFRLEITGDGYGTWPSGHLG